MYNNAFSKMIQQLIKHRRKPIEAKGMYFSTSTTRGHYTFMLTHPVITLNILNVLVNVFCK